MIVYIKSKILQNFCPHKSLNNLGIVKFRKVSSVASPSPFISFTIGTKQLSKCINCLKILESKYKVEKTITYLGNSISTFNHNDKKTTLIYKC